MVTTEIFASFYNVFSLWWLTTNCNLLNLFVTESEYSIMSPVRTNCCCNFQGFTILLVEYFVIYIVEFLTFNFLNLQINLNKISEDWLIVFIYIFIFLLFFFIFIFYFLKLHRHVTKLAPFDNFSYWHGILCQNGNEKWFKCYM